MQVLKKGVSLHPRDQEMIFMIASIYRDQGKIEEARTWAQKLLAINPADQNAVQFIERLNTIQQ